MADFVCHGDILYSETVEKLKVFEDSYLVVQDGFVEGIYETLPEKFRGMELKDYGRGLIIPAFSAYTCVSVCTARSGHGQAAL